MKNKHWIPCILSLTITFFSCHHQPSDDQGLVNIQPQPFLEIKDLPQQKSLPGLMVTESDTIHSVEEWEIHREYLKKMLMFYQYGEMPSKPHDVEVRETERKNDNGRIHSSYDFILRQNGKKLTFRLGLIRSEEEKMYPIIIKNDRYRFDMAEVENKEVRKKYTKQNRLAVDYLVAEEAVKRGYIYCKFVREDVAGDVNRPKKGRIFDLYPEHEWGAITAWAWTYQIIIDWLEKQPFVDSNKIVATGHSRGGKTALCAGVFDERIAITVPNSSGLGGTGSLRFYDFSRGDVQTIDHQIERFSHWWPERWYTLKDHIGKAPFDSHFAKALIAPRALLNTHARHDFWANPYGTYLTYLRSQKPFELYGLTEHNAMHWRDGGHAQDKEDWMALFDYCDWVFYQKPTNRKFRENPYPGIYQFDSLKNHDITKINDDGSK
ncbi:hypothetical protein FNH22_01520 [Fulvivirga sp. M361]|uniref:alpha/beta hydrolase family protein n=1 Tax=Fulvivirga sp. M361 TaxID=2594266 RepID=UPI00117B7884|nr:hypothetical protein [Fulvivirga sp. M361]TRX62031.1 hypothetical protein FNH22_01520 [Fulvivirga sp. M361]